MAGNGLATDLLRRIPFTLLEVTAVSCMVAKVAARHRNGAHGCTPLLRPRKGIAHHLPAYRLCWLPSRSSPEQRHVRAIVLVSIVGSSPTVPSLLRYHQLYHAVPAGGKR